MPKEKHVHKYVRVAMGSRGWTVYKCSIPDCTHFIQEKLVIGRSTICWRCGSTFIMTRHTATLKEPHCRSCTGRNPLERSNNLVDDLSDLIDIKI